MSLVITQSPSTLLQAAFNDSYYCVSGNTYAVSGITDYKYVADVYVGGTLQCTLKSFPDPVYGVGTFNLRNVASAFVEWDFPGINDSIIFQQLANSFASIQLKYREEWVSGSTFSSPTGTTDGATIIYINASLPFTVQQSIQWNQYLMDYAVSGTTGAFMESKQYPGAWNADQLTPPYKSYPNLRSWLNYFNKDSTVGGIMVTVFNSSLSTLRTQFILNPFQALQGVQSVATGLEELSSDIDFTNGAYYDITLVASSGGTAVSPKVRYQILSDCGMFAAGAYRLYWMGYFGEFNSWLFNKINVTTQNKTTATFKRIQGKVGSGGTFVVPTNAPAQLPFYTVLQDSIVINTDFLSDTDVVFLKSLFSSPVVYMEDPQGNILSVSVQDQSYVLNKVVNNVDNKHYNLSLTIQPSYNDYRQSI